MEIQMQSFKKPAVALLFAAAMILGACSHHRGAMDNSSGVASGEIRPADTNATTPAGPAVVDSTGRVYVSSNAPGSGNAATAGTNTNVSVVPQSSSSSVSVTQTSTTVTEPMISSTPAPEPAPVVEQQTTETTSTTTTHRRMHKD
jgi:hypothetical protein